MATQTIILIRHAEKPDETNPGSPRGVDGNGAEDHHSLTPQGWQRAGAWAELFAPSLPGAGSLLPRPDAILASRRTETENGIGSQSRRPRQTVEPLADKLGLEIGVRFTKGEEADLVEALLPMSGTVLVCWQHEKLPGIARRFKTRDGAARTPEGWPDDRFNPILRFRREGGEDAWEYDQLVPLMLTGDVADQV